MNFLPEYSFEDILRYGIAILVFASGILTILYILWGWLLMVVSGGDEKKVQSAVNHMRYAVLGIVVLIIIIFVSPVFLRIIGLSNYSILFTPAEIISTLREVSAYVFGASNDTVINSGNVIPSVRDPGFTDL